MNNMKCPTDNETLVMSERSGIEIDYCQKCRGVWLDRGELDKIIEKNATNTPFAGHQSSAPQVANSDYTSRDKRYSEDRDYNTYSKKRHKRESFLGELFDF